jgi:hypothetical protein
VRTSPGIEHQERRKTPQLQVVTGLVDSALWGYCSACANTKFGSTLELTDRNQQRQRLKYLFNQHFAKVHLQP